MEDEHRGLSEGDNAVEFGAGEGILIEVLKQQNRHCNICYYCVRTVYCDIGTPSNQDLLKT